MRYVYIKRTVDITLATLVVVDMTALVGVVLWQIISRFFAIPSTTTDELACLQMIGIALLGGAYTVGQKRHLSIDVLTTQLAGTSRTIVELLYHLVVFAFSFLVMILGGLWLYQLSIRTGQISPALAIPVGYLYLILPLAGLFICLYSGLFMIDLFLDRNSTTAERASH